MLLNLHSRARVVATMAVMAVIVPTSDVARAHEPDATEIALGSLVDAVLTLARMSLEQGIRAAFLANFSSDGVVFEPAPVRLRAAWAARHAAAGERFLKPPAVPAHHRGIPGGRLRTRTRDARHVWRVGIDIGTTTPEAPDFVPLGAAPTAAYVGKTAYSAQRSALLALVRRPVTSKHAYADLLALDARLYRDGRLPISGRAAVAEHVASRAMRIEWLPFEVRMSRSADMAATYGSFHAGGGSDGDRDGYYVHVWLRDARGRWRLAYDITNL